MGQQFSKDRCYFLNHFCSLESQTSPGRSTYNLGMQLSKWNLDPSTNVFLSTSEAVIWTQLPESRNQCTSFMDQSLNRDSDFFLFSDVWQELNRKFQQIDFPVFIIRTVTDRQGAEWATSGTSVCCIIRKARGLFPVSCLPTLPQDTRILLVYLENSPEGGIILYSSSQKPLATAAVQWKGLKLLLATSSAAFVKSSGVSWSRLMHCRQNSFFL